MKIIIPTPPSSSKKSHETYLRFLKPGALAKLRDSRINARSSSHRIDFKLMISSIGIQSPPHRIPNLHAEANDDANFLCFTGRINGPRFPQRKKLMAARSFFFINNSSPPTDSPASVIIDDAFSNDMLAAH
ncbi:uncharacterized protein LOC124940741 [Impatiens glandulifera]|uniref:uncharacterized protein LOC124940741 n=1 Tax=Impatiens glandulifera TaxID=253017 RepID=UPI001FB09FDD|nr:uncharacterized protein LOC124940741 [Impatiens glandulifera]